MVKKKKRPPPPRNDAALIKRLQKVAWGVLTATVDFEAMLDSVIAMSPETRTGKPSCLENRGTESKHRERSTRN